MAPTLEYPDHAWKEGISRKGLEVSIDFLPSKYEGRWLNVVRDSTDKWVRSEAFKKKGTIWMWGTISANFLPENSVPSWSEFIVPVGFPSSFLAHLHGDLLKAFSKGVRLSEAMRLVRDDGWTPVCHVEQSITWRQEDADLWIPYEGKSGS